MRHQWTLLDVLLCFLLCSLLFESRTLTRASDPESPFRASLVEVESAAQNETGSCQTHSTCNQCMSASKCKWCPRKSFGPAVFSTSSEGVCAAESDLLENGCVVTAKESKYAKHGWIHASTKSPPKSVCNSYKHAFVREPLYPSLIPSLTPSRSAFGTSGLARRVRSVANNIRSSFKVGCSEGLDCMTCTQLRSKVDGACKFCPSDYIVDKNFVSELPEGATGACFAVGSTDIHARDTYEHLKGACIVPKADNEHAIRGWLRGVDRDKPASAKLAKEICEPPSPKAAATTMSFRQLPALETLQRNKITLRVLEGLSHELQQLLYLRSADFAFFARAFKSHFKSPHVSKQKVMSVVPHISMVGNPRAEGFGFYRSLLSAGASGLLSKGGSQGIFVFKDVSYNNIWTAYVSLLDEVYEHGVSDPSEILSKLKESSHQILDSELMKNTEKAVATHNALTGTEGRIMRTAGKILLGLSIPFTFGTLSIAAEAADMALMLSLEGKRSKNVELKAQILLGALYGYENELLQGTSCSILKGGCSSGQYCKREFVFLPQDSASFISAQHSPAGVCAKTESKLLGVGMACSLHSDCATGYCSFGALSVGTASAKQATFISARLGYVRGDAAVDSSRHVTLTAEQRLIALSGVCMKVAPVGTRGCRQITSDHQFFECPPKKR